MALSIKVQESEAHCCNYEYSACKQYRARGRQYFSRASGRGVYSFTHSACCANGSGGCNVFCCNCDDGCHYSRYKRSAIGHKAVGQKIMKGN